MAAMSRHALLRALMLGIFTSGLFLAGCSTIDTRISSNPEIFEKLSPRDQALVREGRIRDGMPQGGVWLAWGTPDQKGTGFAHGRPVETWIYNEYIYANAPYPFPVGRFGYGGFVGGGTVFHNYRNRRFVVVGDPFFNPFAFSYIQPRVPYPAKTVTFTNGRVVSLLVLTPPRS